MSNKVKLGFCKSCGEWKNICYPNQQCQACWKYFKRGGKAYPLPEYGKIEKDSKGNPICHICGRSFSKLGSHVYNHHGITRKEYCKQYGLDITRGICSDSVKGVLRGHVEDNYDKVVSDNLINNPLSISHRFIKGSSGRTRDKISQQTLNRLKRI